MNSVYNVPGHVNGKRESALLTRRVAADPPAKNHAQLDRMANYGAPPGAAGRSA